MLLNVAAALYVIDVLHALHGLAICRVASIEK